MKIEKITQRTSTDCLRCCVAMVTGLPYDEVPDFVALHDTNWACELSLWLINRGMGLMQFSVAPVFIPSWLPIITKGYPSVGAHHHHCVVWTDDGMIDPSPRSIGVIEISEWYVVIKKPENAKYPDP